MPLLGTHKPWRAEHRQNFLRPGSAAQQLIQRTAGRHTLAAFTSEDQKTTLLQDTGAGTHPLDALIEVHVQWVTTIGCHYNVEGTFNRLHGSLFHALTSLLMGLNQPPGKDTGDGSLVIERDIE